MVPFPEDYANQRFTITATTPTKQIRWFAPSGFANRAQAEKEIEEQSTDDNYQVVVLEGAFLPPPEVPIPPGHVSLGLCDVNRMVIYVTAFPSGLPCLRTLRHEYHHVTLWNTKGTSDYKHLDPSWEHYR